MAIRHAIVVQLLELKMLSLISGVIKLVFYFIALYADLKLVDHPKTR